MIEVPKELQKFNIKVVCCDTQPNTHEWLIKKITKKIEEERRKTDDTVLPGIT